jgi:hypothetical protein
MSLTYLRARMSRLGDCYDLDAPGSAAWGWMSFVHASVLASAAALVLHGLARRTGAFHDTYREFIVGILSASGQVKTLDYAFVAVWLAIFAAAFALSQLVFRRLTACCAAPAEPRQLTLLAYVPAVPVLTALWGSPLDLWVVGLSILALMVLPFAALLAWRFGQGFAAGELEDFAAAVWAMALFAVCVPIAFNLVSARLLPGASQPVPALKLAATGAGMAAIAAFLFARSLSDVVIKAKEAVLLLQIPLPLLLLVALPSPILVDDRPFMAYGAKPALYGLLVILVAASWFSLARRWMAFARQESTPATKILDPLCVAAILAFIAYPLIAPLLSTDDFHFGEKLYGWHQWWAFGQLPFVDTVQVHGLVDVMPGLLALWFYDGALAALAPGEALIRTILGIGIVVTLARMTGAAWALLLALPISAHTHFLRLAPLFILAALLLDRPLIGRPARWLIIWGLGSLLIAFWYPAGGTAMIIGSLPFVVHIGLRLSRSWRADRHGAIALGAVVAAVLLALALTPLGRMALGVVDFLLEGARLNSIAYGLPLRWETTAELARIPGAMRSDLMFHLLRFMWLPLAALAALRLVAELVRSRRDPAAVLGWLLVMGTALISVPYSLGRVDPFAFSRLGKLTMLIAGLFMLASSLERERARVYVGFAVLALAALPGWPAGWIQAAISKPHAKPAFSAPTGASMALARELGYGPVLFPEPDRLQRLAELRRIIDGVLEPDETFYDMTNRSALYTYMHRRMPVSWAAVYTDISAATQARTVRQLEAARPPLLLLGPGLNYDGVKPSLRTYWVYRQVMALGYEPRRIGEYDFLVRPDRAARLDGLRVLRVKNFDDVNWKAGILRAGGTAFLVADLASLVGLAVGDTLDFAASGPRKITAISKDRVDLDGAIDAQRDGFPRLARAAGKPLLMNEPKLAFYDRVFAMSSLGWTPQTWGRSWSKLQGRMQEVARLDLAKQDLMLHSLSRARDVYRVTGPDPHVTIQLARPLAGTDAGMATFRFECVEGTPTPSRSGHRLRLYWNSSEFGMSELTMVEFQASRGALIVPVDQQPRWLQSKAITQVRFDLESSGCTAFRLSDAALMARDDLGR